ncbi:MAG: hypothetical protein L0H43_13390, partial [Brevibacterium aurantiacum]|nr:hypothetical protein [Brevibacterium aurantiacum]
NVGNAIGPALGAAVIALGWGFTAPVVVAIVLALASLVVVAVAIRVERVWSTRIGVATPEEASDAVA